MCIVARKTSDDTIYYNCYAWAAGQTDRWLSPRSGDFWPNGITREETLRAYISAYEREYGYEICESEVFEEGFEKIAIYVDHNQIPIHAARQRPNGKWTSKLGIFEDVEHEFSQNLVIHFYPRGEQNYGKLGVIMSRPKDNHT